MSAVSCFAVGKLSIRVEQRGVGRNRSYSAQAFFSEVEVDSRHYIGGRTDTMDQACEAAREWAQDISDAGIRDALAGELDAAGDAVIAAAERLKSARHAVLALDSYEVSW